MKRLIFVVFAVLFAGCSGIATSGPVEEITLPADQPGIDIAPQPAQADDTPSRIVEGFLLASANPNSDYAVARTYLTPETAALWRPDSSLTVYLGEVVENENDFSLAGKIVGRVDPQGRYVATDEELIHDFGLVEVDGQWRINNPPSGILLTRYLFERYYSPLTLYFMAPSDDYLIPDFRIVSEERRTPEEVVKRLFQGPSPELVPLVVDAFPDGLRLGHAGATISESGVITVDFAGLSFAMESMQRKRLGVQLLWSLAGLPRVTGLRITNEGRDFQLPGQDSDGVLSLAGQHSYQVLSGAPAGDLFAIKDSVIGRVTDSDQFIDLGLPGITGSEVAVSLDQRYMSIINEERTSLKVGQLESGFIEVPIDLTGIRETQWALGNVFGLGEDSRGRTLMFRVSPTGEYSLVPVDLPSGRMISFSLNQAGGWAAMLRLDGEKIQLGLMSMAHDGSLSGWRQVPVVADNGISADELRDVRWNSESTLVVLGQVDGMQTIFNLRADGAEIEELGGREEYIASVTALPRPGGGLITIRSRSGTLWRYSSPGRWISTGLTVSSASYAG